MYVDVAHALRKQVSRLRFRSVIGIVGWPGEWLLVYVSLLSVPSLGSLAELLVERIDVHRDGLTRLPL